MPKRIKTPAKDFGLVAWLEETRITLPLKGVECRFAVCGDLLNVEIDQIFHQNSSRPLDCLYTFPLPASAAVYRCEMHVNDRVIRARVEEAEKAREIVREKKAAGFRTSLVEMERDNLFTLSLGNVQPEDIVVIRFAYFETLTRLADWTSLRIPFCPGVRYIPGTPLLRASKGRGAEDDTDQVPDASRISPPRIDRLHADAAYLAIEGTVEHLTDLRDITSPTHPVLVQDGTSVSTILLAKRATAPDSDFVLRWTEVPATDLKPVGWVVRAENESFALLRLEAPARAEAAADYAQDVYFLLDRSGSMEGLKWEKTVAAFREFVKVLGPKDRVWATLFESTFRDFAEKPMSPSQILRDPMAQKLETLGVAGGTALLPALQHVLEKISTHSPDRPASLVLITDGQVGNEQQILAHLRPYSNLRVHTFGIDLAINDGFLKRIASQHRGTSCLLAPSDDIVGAVARLGDRLRRPVLTAIQAGHDWQPPNGALPDLHAGESLSVTIKGPTDASAVSVRGQLAGRSEKIYNFDLVPKDLPAVRLLWAKRRIEHHLASGEREAALVLARKHNLICEGAAFVAWDETEKVPVSVAGDEIYQPSCEPAYVGSRRRGKGIVAMSLGYITPSDSTHYLHGFMEDDDVQASAPGQLFISRLSDPLRPQSAPANAPVLPPLLDLDKLRDVMRGLWPSPEGQVLSDFLYEWACGAPAQVQVRRAQLEELLEKLVTSASDPTAQLIVIAQWIKGTWKNGGSFANRALKLLDAMSTAAPV